MRYSIWDTPNDVGYQKKGDIPYTIYQVRRGIFIKGYTIWRFHIGYSKHRRIFQMNYNKHKEIIHMRIPNGKGWKGAKFKWQMYLINYSSVPKHSLTPTLNHMWFLIVALNIWLYFITSIFVRSLWFICDIKAFCPLSYFINQSCFPDVSMPIICLLTHIMRF